MTDDAATDFLDLACLAYKGADSPERRARAKAMLAADPTLGSATLAGASVSGNAAAIRSWLEIDPLAHSRPSGSRSWPALFYLCYSRIPQQDARESLELLLAAGADPTAHFVSWGYPFTAITGAIGQGEQGPERLPGHPDALALVTRLLDAGASPNDCQALYNTMLGGDAIWLRLFLSRGLTAEDRISWPIEGGARSLDFVLAHAVDTGDLERVELLLAHRANPDCVNTYNGRPVHTNALVAGHDEVVERLVAAGATRTRLDPAQQFERALNRGDVASAGSLSTPEFIADPRYLLAASDRGALESVRFLLVSGADASGADQHGVTPLHHAAWSDHVEIVQLLLDHGADTTLRERNHDATPYGWAAHNGSHASAKLLEGAG